MWKVILIFSFGVGHPATSGVFEAWAYRPVAVGYINSQNDHTWLVASRVFIVTGALAAFKWGQQHPSTGEVLLTSVGTILLRDSIANLAFQKTLTGNAFTRQPVPAVKIGPINLNLNIELDGKARVFEGLAGVGLIWLSERI